MIVDIVMPQLGESVAEGTILKWHKKVGDTVAKDEVIYEVSTDKIDTEIPSPAAGTLVEILAQEEQTVDVGTVVARIDTVATATATAQQPRETPTAQKAPTPPSVTVEETPTTAKPHMGGESGKQETRVISRDRGARSSAPQTVGPTIGVIKREKTFLSPVVRKMMKEFNVSENELASVSGSGAQGRITKIDMQGYVQQRKASPRPLTAPARPPVARPLSGTPAVETEPIPAFMGDRVEKMSNMRKKIAEHMVFSRHTSAHCQMFHEADVTDLVNYRLAKTPEYVSHGVKLTYTPLLLKPLMKAIRDFPIFNASVENDQIIYHENINMGVAVALDKGLIVPVIKSAENLSLLGLTKAVQDLSTRARENKLKPDDVSGGTFTLTNPGMYGTVLSAPIINQPQVAIFSPGAIQKKVVVKNDNTMAIRDMMYLSLSFDHRVIDGATAGSFLKNLTGYLENDFS